MSGKKWKLRQDGRMHYTLLEDADVPANVHTPPIAFLSFVEQQHRDLIVAAPEMLEALERILPAAMALARKQPSYDQFGDIDFAKATIAKAKGAKP